jgi:uncharacterized PurR-regulated membrane protein YhhQ (DUF165 family)
VKATLRVLSVLAFIGLIVTSNALTAQYGLVFGFIAAGTFTAGLVLAARDAVRETSGVWASLACILAGAAVSIAMASPQLAFASAVAFLVSELADLMIYEPLRNRGRMRALAWSNLIGSVVDSCLFLWLASFGIWPAIAGQVGGKWIMAVLLPLAGWWIIRRRRQPRFA